MTVSREQDRYGCTTFIHLLKPLFSLHQDHYFSNVDFSGTATLPSMWRGYHRLEVKGKTELVKRMEKQEEECRLEGEGQG